MAYRGQLSRKALVRTMSRGGLDGSTCHVLGESLLSCLHDPDERLPLIAQREAILPVCVTGMKLNLCCFPDDLVHVSKFLFL
jgi:hypothetical protein